MPSTYTTSLRLTLPANGELAGTWGTTVNAGVTSLAEAAIAGTAAVAMIDADYTLSVANGSTDQARNMFVTLTGTLSAARNVICPPVSKLYFVTNNTTGGYAITFKTLAGTGISVPNGQRAVLYCNGTDVLGGLTALDSLSLNGSLTLVGGTANGVLYLNGSKAVTSGSALTFNGTNLGVGVTSPSQKLDILGGIAVRAATSGANQDIIALRTLNSDNTAYANAIYYANSHRWAYAGATEGMRLDSSGNLGLGVTPSAWSGFKAIQVGNGAFGDTASAANNALFGSNTYYNGAAFTYINTTTATLYRQLSGQHLWYTAPSGTAGNAISFTQAMTLDASGNLGVGTSSPVGRLTIQGAAGTSGINQGIGLLYSNGTQFGALGLNNLTGWPQLMARAGAGLTFHVNSDLVTTGEVMRLDASGNLGLGVTPSAWNTSFKALEYSAGYVAAISTNELDIGQNNFYSTSLGTWTYKNTAGATQYRQTGSEHRWYTAPSGTAGNAVTFTQAMTLDASGNLGIGTSSPITKLAIQDTERLEFGGSSGFMYSQTLNAARTATVESRAYASFLSWWTGASGAQTEKMRLDSSGNLGIGTSSPIAATGTTVDVAGASGASQRWRNNAGTSSAYLEVAAGATNFGNVSSTPITFVTAATERMRLDSSGNLGIGTSSPDVKLRLAGANVPAKGQLVLDGGSGFTQWTFYNGATRYFQCFADTSGSNTGAFFGTTTAQPLIFTTSNADRLTIDSSGNLGLGVTPSAWGSSDKAIDIGGSNQSTISGNAATTVANGAYFTGTNWIYKTTGVAPSLYQQTYAGQHLWRVAPSGTAGNAISFTQAMTLDASGNLLVGGTATPYSAANRGYINISGTTDAVLGLSSGAAARGYLQGTATAVTLGATTGSSITFDINGERMRLDSSGNLGIGTTSPVNKLDIVGSFGRGAPVTKTADFTLAATENWVICNKSGSNCVVTLPAASSWTGREVTFVNRQASSFGVVSASSNVVPRSGGAPSTAIAGVGTNSTWSTLVSDGTNWIIMASS